MRWKFHSAVKIELAVIHVSMSQCCTEMNITDANPEAILPPDADCLAGVGELLRSVNNEERGSVNADVTLICEKRNEALDEIHIIIREVSLRDEDLMFRRVPTSSPILISPAKAVRHAAFRVDQHVVKRSIQEAFSGKPVIVVTECVDTELFGKSNLFVAHLSQTQIVETEI